MVFVEEVRRHLPNCQFSAQNTLSESRAAEDADIVAGVVWREGLLVDRLENRHFLLLLVSQFI